MQTISPSLHSSPGRKRKLGHKCYLFIRQRKAGALRCLDVLSAVTYILDLSICVEIISKLNNKTIRDANADQILLSDIAMPFYNQLVG